MSGTARPHENNAMNRGSIRTGLAALTPAVFLLFGCAQEWSTLTGDAITDGPGDPDVELEIAGDIAGEEVECAEGETLCTGVCTDTMTDHANCGACGRECGPAEVCYDGDCALECPPGKIACSGTCVDPDSDPLNCGSCGHACGDGEECCEGACADLSSDVTHCGACGSACPDRHVCSGGACESVCAPLADCGGSCVDTSSDLHNCGTCGNDCGSDHVDYGEWYCTQRGDGSWLQRRTETSVEVYCSGGSCGSNSTTCTMSCGCSSSSSDECAAFPHRCCGSSCCSGGMCTHGTYSCYYMDC